MSAIMVSISPEILDIWNTDSERHDGHSHSHVSAHFALVLGYHRKRDSQTGDDGTLKESVEGGLSLKYTVSMLSFGCESKTWTYDDLSVCFG